MPERFAIAFMLVATFAAAGFLLTALGKLWMACAI